jgi:hypothetical protein
VAQGARPVTDRPARTHRGWWDREPEEAPGDPREGGPRARRGPEGASPQAEGRAEGPRGEAPRADEEASREEEGPEVEAPERARSREVDQEGDALRALARRRGRREGEG